jgi:hypothetical protein
MKKVKSFEHACELLKINPTLPVVKGLPKEHQEAIISHYQLVIITQAINNGWKPDWSNSNQYKYHPWMKVKASAECPAGSGLSFHGYGRWLTDTGVGSRLCFVSSEAAEYAGKKFADLYAKAWLYLQ